MEELQRTLLRQKTPKRATNLLRKVTTQMWFWTLLAVRTLKLCMAFKVLLGMVSLQLQKNVSQFLLMQRKYLFWILALLLKNNLDPHW